jgi:hypothetical protein
MSISAYWSNDLKSWVRLERLIDGEYCHTSGYSTREEALGSNYYEEWIHPCDN